MKRFCVRLLWERLRRGACSRGFGVQSPSDYRFITGTLRGELPAAVCAALPADGATAKLCRLVYLVCEKHRPRRVVNLTKCAEIDAFVRFAATDCEVSHAATGQSTAERTSIGQSTALSTDILIVDARLLASGSVNSSDLFSGLNSPARIIVANIHASGEAFRAWRTLASEARATVFFDLYSSGVALVDEKRYRAEYALWF